MDNVPAPWISINPTQVLIDDITNSKCGNINNGNGTINQVFNITPNETYHVVFNYRWVSGAGSYNMTASVKESDTGINDIGILVLNTVPDIWHTGSFLFTAPIGVTKARIVFFKDTGNRSLRMDNVYIALKEELTAYVDTNTALTVQPLVIAGV